MLISITISEDLALSSGLDCALTALAFEQPPTVVFIGTGTASCDDVLATPIIAAKLANLLQNNIECYYLAPQALEKASTLREQFAIPRISPTAISALLRTHDQCVSF